MLVHQRLLEWLVTSVSPVHIPNACHMIHENSSNRLHSWHTHPEFLSLQLRFYFPGLKEHLQTIRAFAPLGWPLQWRPARGWAHHRWPPRDSKCRNATRGSSWNHLGDAKNRASQWDGPEGTKTPKNRIRSAHWKTERSAAKGDRLTSSQWLPLPSGKKTGQALSFPQTPQHSFWLSFGKMKEYPEYPQLSDGFSSFVRSPTFTIVVPSSAGELVTQTSGGCVTSIWVDLLKPAMAKAKLASNHGEEHD